MQNNASYPFCHYEQILAFISIRFPWNCKQNCYHLILEKQM